jgi:hypothetical protein
MAQTKLISIEFEEGRFQIPAKKVEGGLALHRAYYFVEGGPRPCRRGWGITHLESGLNVLPLMIERGLTYRRAVQLFRGLLELTDWTRPHGELVKDRSLRQRMEELLADLMVERLK